jgi:hypothetical protein
MNGLGLFILVGRRSVLSFSIWLVLVVGPGFFLKKTGTKFLNFLFDYLHHWFLLQFSPLPWGLAPPHPY